jgi:hypothetical protein
LLESGNFRLAYRHWVCSWLDGHFLVNDPTRYSLITEEVDEYNTVAFVSQAPNIEHDYVSGRSSSISRHQRTRGATLLSTTHYSNLFFCFQHESWPRFTPLLPPRPLPRPTFNLSSMLPSRHMRKRQSASFSLILLPPSCSPATPPSPFYPSFKTLSSNSITVAAVMRD